MDMVQYGRPNSRQELDIFLRFGWFRTGLHVFTCDFIDFDHVFYRTIWLRHDLREFVAGKTWKNLSKRNRDFRVEFSKATINEEQALLFRLYRNAMPFEPANDLHQLLFDHKEPINSPFETQQVCLYDGCTLVGCSYFDTGIDSVAGISAFYHPDYAHYSIGIYLIYCQILHSMNVGYRYYYPGYFIPHYTHFDYKLNIGRKALYFFDVDEKRWEPISSYVDKPFPYNSINR
jgi:arginyl-tRNA--protein-N-Asp/Glu arginylyltransferase